VTRHVICDRQAARTTEIPSLPSHHVTLHRRAIGSTPTQQPHLLHVTLHRQQPTIMETITLPHLSDSPTQICLFKNVQNAAFLRQQLLEGNTDFEYAFLDASVLVSRTHVLAACFKAIQDSLHDRLKSRNVHSEIVFSLSPNNNVRCPSFQSPLHSLIDILDRRIFPPLWYSRHKHPRGCCQSPEEP
jgi:hypothetical protein